MFGRGYDVGEIYFTEVTMLLMMKTKALYVNVIEMEFRIRWVMYALTEGVRIDPSNES